MGPMPIGVNTATRPVERYVAARYTTPKTTQSMATKMTSWSFQPPFAAVLLSDIVSSFPLFACMSCAACHVGRGPVRLGGTGGTTWLGGRDANAPATA